MAETAAPEKRTHRRRQSYTLVLHPVSKKFARVSFDITPMLAEVIDVLNAYAFESRDTTVRRFLLCTCRLSSSTFRSCLASRPPVELGDRAWGLPIDERPRERTAWAFTSCHYCAAGATERFCVLCMVSGEPRTTLICPRCALSHPVRHGFGPLAGGRPVLAHDSLSRRFVCSMHPDDNREHLNSVIAWFAWACRRVVVKVQRVSVQTWTGHKRHSIVRIHQLTLTLCMPEGRPEARIAVQLHSKDARAMRAIETSAEKLYFVLLKMAGVHQQCAFVRAVSDWAFVYVPAVPTSATNQRKATDPARLLCVPCVHSYNDTRRSRLLTCTMCCPNGTRARSRRRRGNDPTTQAVIMAVDAT